MYSKYAQYRQSGVTLIELMVVVALIAIIGAFAVTNYSEYVKRGYRTDAQAKIIEAVVFMQRYYSTHDSYYKEGSTSLAPDLPTNMTVSPSGGGAARYAISVTPTAVGFTVKAQPIAGGAMGGDKCGTMSITSTGTRSVSSGTVAECWRS